MNRSRRPGRARSILAGVAAAALLCGCGAIQIQPKPVAAYDLGLAERQVLAAELAPAQIEVLTPPWLTANAMQYRLAWDQPERRRAFAESRWVALPADLLGLALDRALLTGGGSGRCRLHIELDEFVQVFDSVERSAVEIVVRAGLLAPRSDSAFARREFHVKEPAPSADALGGVSAYRVAVDRLAGELAGWIVALDRMPGQGLNEQGRCGV